MKEVRRALFTPALRDRNLVDGSATGQGVCVSRNPVLTGSSNENPK